LVPAKIPGTNTLLIEVGEKGMNAIVLGVYHNRGKESKNLKWLPLADGRLQGLYQRVPLDSRFKASDDMKLLMATYQGQLKDLGFAGLRVNTAPDPRSKEMGTYVGSERCQNCHDASYRVWKHSGFEDKSGHRGPGHSDALATLEKRVDPPRDHDPECISCHVVGWNPSQFFPYEGGFRNRTETPKLANVGCEDCHGPGEFHCQAEIKADKAIQEKLRKAMTVTKADAEKHLCTTCHDLDNSPDFEFEAYWPYVEHHEGGDNTDK
jgi:hypothetical protein